VAKKRERPLGHPEPDTQEEKEETKQATLGNRMDNGSKNEKRINTNENNNQKTRTRSHPTKKKINKQTGT
jgi:hypothetical protein